MIILEMPSNEISASPLVKKLGIKSGYKVYLKDAPEDYFDMIYPIPEDVEFLDKLPLRGELDMIHVFVTKRKDLVKPIHKYFRKIKKNGMIWISWPKKSSKIDTELYEYDIRDLALPIDLVDVKVCSVNKTWSALKLVIRKDKR